MAKIQSNDRFGFKVILRLQPNAKAIGYVVRNNEGTKRKDQFVNSVDQVERITGIDFFPTLPDSIENVLEAKADLRDWNTNYATNFNY